MSEMGLEIGLPSEGQSGAPEQLSEEAKQRFAAAAAALKAIQREEKRSKKRDARVARTIVQFLNDDRFAHLFVLISRLVAKDCPSIFILAVLSLIDPESQVVIAEYVQDSGQKEVVDSLDRNIQILASQNTNASVNTALFEWVTRMQSVLSLEAQGVLSRLLVDEGSIDGTVLQLTSFVLQEFFQSPAGGLKKPPFEQIQNLAVNILQSVFEPFMSLVQLPKKNLEDANEE
jgi:hypothetical protein